MDTSPTPERRIISRVLFASLGVVVVILLVTLLGVVRMVHQRTRFVETLQQFDSSSISASYIPYEYQPWEKIGGQLEGSGLRFSGSTFGGGGTGPIWARAFDKFTDYRPFAEIESVSIRDEQFSDANVPLVLGIYSLRVLDLSMTRITDQGIAQLSKISRLTKLNLSHTEISDRSLLMLDELHELRELAIVNTKVSKQAADEFRKRHPDCLVHD